MTVERVGKQIAIAWRFGSAVMCRLLRIRWPLTMPGRFSCRVEQQLDESCPPYEDQFLCVEMFGQINTAKDKLDTDVRVGLLDITEGGERNEDVLSVSSQWHKSTSPVFHYQAHNGIIPSRNVVLERPIPVARIPLHELRFARRGRRKIRICVTILSRDTGQIIAQAQTDTEYVACCEGFVEMQERHESVLQAGVELACAVAAETPFMPEVAEVIGDWIAEKTRRFMPRSNLSEPLNRLIASNISIDTAAACERILAMGKASDAMAAMDLAVQVAALYPTPSSEQKRLLWSLADGLGISIERFRTLCQKWLLTERCSSGWSRLLLGIRHDLPPDELRSRLNEEYRKWNARVTHNDARIRQQADIILSLIAEVRSGKEAVLSSS